MSVLTIILGIIMVICGTACLFTPLATTFSIMYFFMVLLFLTGILFLVNCIATKKFGINLVFAIVSIIAGGFMVFSPVFSFATDAVMLYVMAGWLTVRGIVGIIDAFKAKKEIGGGLFALSLIFSVLVIGSGIYSFIHPLIFAGFLGILASCYFIVEGFDMIFFGCLAKDIEDVIKKGIAKGSEKENEKDTEKESAKESEKETEKETKE